MSERWTFRVMQDGIEVASGDCPDQPTAMREAMHYCAMYGQDGPVKALVGPADPQPESPNP